jgi:predicted heme/steroid binding protein
MTLQQLRKYDGVSPESEGRICVAVNGKIFDVTRVITDPEHRFSHKINGNAMFGLKYSIIAEIC